MHIGKTKKKKIIIGCPGLGKSRKCMEEAIRCKDTVFYLCACPDGADYYLQYPELDFAHRFEKQTNLRAFHVTQGSKYFITPSEKK